MSVEWVPFADFPKAQLRSFGDHPFVGQMLAPYETETEWGQAGIVLIEIGRRI